MLRWIRWWLLLLTVSAICFHIVKAADDGRQANAHFKSVPKPREDGTRELRLPTVGGRSGGSFEQMTWFDMLGGLFAGQPMVDSSGLEAALQGFDVPIYDADDFRFPPGVGDSGRREGSLDRAAGSSARNGTFGRLSNQ